MTSRIAAFGFLGLLSALGSGDAGFRLVGAGNVLSQNVGKGSAGFDLHDASGGANTVETDNIFKTTGP